MTAAKRRTSSAAKNLVKNKLSKNDSSKRQRGVINPSLTFRAVIDK